MAVYVLPAIWDAQKFATRYGLNPHTNDFYVDGTGQLVVSVTLPDDPPIFEAPDPFVPVPAGVQAHHWPQLHGWIGTQKKIMDEPSPGHHECYWLIADDFASLESFRAYPNAALELGQPAYLKDTKTFVMWDGVTWVGFRVIAPAQGAPTVNLPSVVTGTNQGGIITVGAVGTANIVLTFSVPFAAVPVVAISVSTNLCQVSAVATTTNITFKSNNNQINGKTISYICQ